MKLYLLEYYTKKEFINFAWIYANSKKEALVKANTIKDFDEKILITEEAEITPLKLTDNQKPVIIGEN